MVRAVVLTGTVASGERASCDGPNLIVSCFTPHIFPCLLQLRVCFASLHALGFFVYGAHGSHDPDVWPELWCDQTLGAQMGGEMR